LLNEQNKSHIFAILILKLLIDREEIPEIIPIGRAFKRMMKLLEIKKEVKIYDWLDGDDRILRIIGLSVLSLAT